MSLSENKNGFTLIEVLISVFIFSLIATMIFGAYHTILSNSGQIRSDMVVAEAGARAMGRICDDLAGVYVAVRPGYQNPDDRGEDDDPYRFEGDLTVLGFESFSRIRFTSTSHIAFEGNSGKGIAEIHYYVDKDDMERQVLRRADRLFFDEPFEPSDRDPIVCTDVASFKLTYYDADDESYDTWHSDDSGIGFATPSSVGVKLALGDESSSRPFETRVRLWVVRPAKD